MTGGEEAGVDLTSAAFSLPSEDEPSQRAWAIANAAARHEAIHRTRGWLGGWFSDDPADEDMCRPHHVDARGLLGEADLLACVEDFLEHADLDGGRFEVASSGSPDHDVPPAWAFRPVHGRTERRSARPAGLLRLLSGGATLVLNGVVHQGSWGVQEVAEVLDSAFGVRIGMNAYVSGAGSEGFGAHWDDHDLLIVQVSGSKTWTLEEPLEPDPIRGISSPVTSGRVVASVTLKEGEALWLPRGYGHSTTTGASSSVHLSCYVPRLLLADLTPVVLRRALDGVPGVLDRHSVSMSIRNVDAGALIRRSTASARALLPPRREGSALAAAAFLVGESLDELVIGTSMPGGFVCASALDPTRRHGVEHPFSIVGGGRVIRSRDGASEVLQHLGPVGRRPATDFAADAVHHLRDLVVNGVVYVERRSR